MPIKKYFFMFIFLSLAFFTSSLNDTYAATAEACPQNVINGAYFQVSGDDRSVYTMSSQGLFYYPSAGYLRMWDAVPTSYTSVNADCFDYLASQNSSTLSIANRRYGTHIVQHRYGSQLYVIEPGNKLVPITADAAKYLYGNRYGNYAVAKLNQLYWDNYTVDTSSTISLNSNNVVNPHPGMLINVDGLVYLVYTDGKLREITEAGLEANKFETRFIRRLSREAVSSMQYGSQITAEISAITDYRQATQYPTDNGTPKLPATTPVLSVTADSDSIDLSWGEFTGSNFKYYRLVRSEVNTKPVFPVNENDVIRYTGRQSSDVSFEDKKVSNDKTYYYTLCVQTSINTYLCSNSVSDTLEAPTPNPPAAPVLQATASDTVSLSWGAYSGDNFKAYHVMRSASSTGLTYPANASLSDITTSSTVTYTDSSVSKSTTYYYSVCAEDTYSQVACSNTVSVTTDDPTPPPASYGTTYYIRTDGGSYEQCDGKTNVAYSSSITDRKCAVNHPFQLFPPEGSARIAGGDTVVIATGEYMMGYGAPGAESCSSSYPWDCYMPPIPSGPDKDHPTRMVGEGYLTNSSQKAKLWGTERAKQIISLTSSNNIVLANLEITDKDQCVQHHSGSITCNRSSYPYGKWSPTGILAHDSSNVLLENMNIHGLSDKGVWAGRLTDWTVKNTRIAYNGWVGWDGDLADGSSSSNSGTMKFADFTVEWNGCGETAHGEPIGCWSQSAGGYGDGMGTAYTAGNWIFEDSKFLHNTSDGLDLLYARDPASSITINRVKAEGNAGNQIKTTGNAYIKNSLIIGNCGYFTGQSFTHNVDPCRALGNSVSINTTGASSAVVFYNNSVYGEGDVLMMADTDDSSGTVKMRNNIFYGDTDYFQNFEKSAYIYTDTGVEFDQNYNIVYNTKRDNERCSEGTNNICGVDPQFTSVSETEGFKLMPLETSPVIDKGMMDSDVTSTDFLKISRPKGAGVDLGACEVK